jgi:hypothetical protein
VSEATALDALIEDNKISPHDVWGIRHTQSLGLGKTTLKDLYAALERTAGLPCAGDGILETALGIGVSVDEYEALTEAVTRAKNGRSFRKTRRRS